ncbi:hypothetical protein GCM10025868_23760 [Angustibacter aerolatus]|uniref:Uncharacterized protein n=1 Tax=Angustibacter aerolatus TaxID=1162965 RepID=A0ABQ6JK03_9ACTN|nr:hypothetical protein GCM10025868_23760 [Angustibacter aerolatus]
MPGVDALSAYSAGLVSAVVHVLGADPVRIARDTRLDDGLAAAILRHEGQVGALLWTVEQFTRLGTATTLIPEGVLSRTYLEALAGAVEVIDSLQQG